MLERKEAGMVASGTSTFSDTEAGRQAAAHKDKLLEYGRTAAVRTQVFGMHARTICV
jgi:hypothetical protein